MKYLSVAGLVVLLASLGAGCAESTQQGAREDMHNGTPRANIGPSGDRGASARDMPGGGRGSFPTKGNGVNH